MKEYKIDILNRVAPPAIPAVVAARATCRGQRVGAGSTFTVESEATHLVMVTIRPDTSLTVTAGEIIIAMMPPSIKVTLDAEVENG
jgi:hypothetical protein